eukprot:3739344-Rhodomonas_salina.1
MMMIIIIIIIIILVVTVIIIVIIVIMTGMIRVMIMMVPIGTERHPAIKDKKLKLKPQSQSTLCQECGFFRLIWRRTQAQTPSGAHSSESSSSLIRVIIITHP